MEHIKETNKFSTREEEVRASISKEEAARRILNYGAEPDLDRTDFDIYDQLLACEAVAETQEEEARRRGGGREEEQQYNEVYDTGNDTYKPKANFELTEIKLNVIKKLSTYNYKTPIYEISDSLQELFNECESLPSHWSYIAEVYTSRAINRVINYMIKRYGNWHTLQNPAAYFTKAIKFHKKKKEFRNTNDTR